MTPPEKTRRNSGIAGATKGLPHPMAISFHGGFDSLLAELQDAGLQPIVVSATGGTRPRAAEVQLKEQLSVHWDRDTRTVWVEGPWDRAMKLERQIRRRRTKRRLGRSIATPAMALRAAVLVAVLGALLVGSMKWIDSQSQLGSNPVPPAETSAAAATELATQ